MDMLPNIHSLMLLLCCFIFEDTWNLYSTEIKLQISELLVKHFTRTNYLRPIQFFQILSGNMNICFETNPSWTVSCEALLANINLWHSCRTLSLWKPWFEKLFIISNKSKLLTLTVFSLKHPEILATSLAETEGGFHGDSKREKRNQRA